MPREGGGRGRPLKFATDESNGNRQRLQTGGQKRIQRPDVNEAARLENGLNAGDDEASLAPWMPGVRGEASAGVNGSGNSSLTTS